MGIILLSLIGLRLRPMFLVITEGETCKLDGRIAVWIIHEGEVHWKAHFRARSGVWEVCIGFVV